MKLRAVLDFLGLRLVKPVTLWGEEKRVIPIQGHTAIPEPVPVYTERGGTYGKMRWSVLPPNDLGTQVVAKWVGNECAVELYEFHVEGCAVAEALALYLSYVAHAERGRYLHLGIKP